MPPARQTSAARTSSRTDPSVRPQPRTRPEAVRSRLPVSKIAWDRKFRWVMIAVFLLVSWVAVKAGIAVYTSHAQAAAEVQLVHKYSSENHRLEREAKALNQPQTIERIARGLGMIKRGEHAYVVTGLKPDGP